LTTASAACRIGCCASGGVPSFLAELELPDAARERIWGGARDDRRAKTASSLRSSATSGRWRQAGCPELMRHYGIGPVTATSIVCELGDVSRLSASRKAVRCAGLDVRRAAPRPALPGWGS
jgi:transposase